MRDDEDDYTSSKLASPRRRRRKKKKKRDLFNLPGVRKIILTELTQKIIECVVGENVTSESPWKYVRKELVQDNLELHEESSEFLPLRREILAYPKDELLIGYIADETQDRDDEFYICVTAEATEAVQKIIEKLQQEQKERLHYQLYKDIHPWQSMGSEAEVDESIVKNNRPLLEVEVETRYPIFPSKVQFRLVRAENRRDGYMELKCGPEERANVYMRRIDNETQVAPAVVSNEAQTTCTYPKNATTQYLYDPGDTKPLFDQCEPEIVRYADRNIENFSDLLRVNGTINFYANDFDSLVKNEALSSAADRSNSGTNLSEYLSFMDVNLCKGKMISDIFWHPMWSGTIAISYCDYSPIIFHSGPNKQDQVYKAVHTSNLVLIWSFLDALKPKLILESPREVNKISFCKFDENIIIGGCTNGQIVIWDIRNKLQKVEEKEVLTTAQQKYRTYMHSLMGWMKNIHDIARVRATAVSDLRYSHKSIITGISWLDPNYEFSRTGNLSEVEQKADGTPKYSMQMLTTSLDGSILIWDLKDKPTVNPGGYKPKKLKRLKARPSALQLEESPYRVLHLNLKPRYRILVSKDNNKSKPVAITRSSASFCFVKYEEANPDPNRKFDVKERIIYKPILIKQREIKPHIKLGTAEGVFADLRWVGQDFDSGEAVNCEQAQYTFKSKYHDGPISTLHTSPQNHTNLTVGGKIMAIWRTDFPDRPIVWRRSRQFYTKGEFTRFQPFKIVCHSVNGVLSRWLLPTISKSPDFTKMMSNGFVTASATHPFCDRKTMYGIGDEQGAFRLFHINTPSQSYMDHTNKAMDAYIEREINRKKLFLKWQEDFNKKNEGYLLRMKQEAEEKAKEEAAREAAKEEIKLPEKVVKKGPQPGKMVEWIMEQRQLNEQARIKAMIINKKQLDTKDLEKRRKPLQKLDEENERKKRKQKERLKQGETIFRDTVASLFPDVMKEKPPPPDDPYAGGDSKEEKKNCYGEYDTLMTEMDEFIKSHPLEYDFNYKNLLATSRKIDKDCFNSHKHTKRYETEKKLRRGESFMDTVTEKSEYVEKETDDNELQELIEDIDLV